MALVRLLVALSALMCAWAAVQDDCMSLKYVNLHSQDMVVDYRNSWLQGDDTARFKRDMQGGRNPDAHANEFWVIYKSRVGIKKFSTMLNFYRYANLPPEQDRSFLTSTDGVTWSPFTAFTESADLPTGNDAYFIRKYTLLLPDETYFVQMKFANWVYSGSINYWTPQIHNVTFTEVCDSCGNGVCGDGSNSFGEPENCNNCPADCGRCPPPTCGNGVCEFGESWAPRDGVNTMDMGPLTCPEDCGFIQTPGNLRCDTGEVCHSQTQRSCADCCPTDTFVVNAGDCGNGLCDGSETCTTCAGDCGACPSCGDGLCNGVETCRSCVADCGACPDPATCTTAAPPPPPPLTSAPPPPVTSAPPTSMPPPPPPPLTSAPPPPVTSAPPPPPLTTALVPPLTTAAPPSPQRTTEAPPSVPQETSAAPPPPPDTSAAPPPTSQGPASPSPSFSSGDDSNVHAAGAHKSVSKTAVVLISVFSVLAAVAIMVGAFLLFRHLRAAEPKLKAAQEPNAP